MCQNSYLEDIITSEKEFLDEDYEILKQHKLLGHITHKEYMQAYTLFESRTYQITNTNKQNLSAFIPLVDLLNYKANKNEHGHNKVAWEYDSHNKYFKVIAYEDIEPGSKLYIEYGAHSNLQMLLYYGFTYGKPLEKVEYNIYVGSGSEQVVVDLTGDLDLMKTLNPIRHSFSDIKKANEEVSENIGFVSRKNELKSLEKLQIEIENKLKGYHTNLEQDYNRLKNSITENEINILRVTTEERKVII